MGRQARVLVVVYTYRGEEIRIFQREKQKTANERNTANNET